MARSAQAALVPVGRDLRAATRRVVDFAAYVRECEAEVFEVTVIDLSERNCRFASDHHLEPRATIWLKIPDMVARKASIVWTQGAEAECEFASEFHASSVEAAFSEKPRKQLRVFF